MHTRSFSPVGVVAVLACFASASGPQSEGSAAASRSSASSISASHAIRPDLKYPTRESFEQAIRQPAILLDSDHVMLFAPRAREQGARIVFPYLLKAYDELYAIVGVHTKYKTVVYAFPAGNKEGWGGTSECVIKYDDTNLDLEKSSEWKWHRVPHVSGFIEEMAHNFVDATGVQFGWEMVGWSLGAKVSQKVAPNPVLARNLQQTRRGQIDTFKRYTAAGFTFPEDLPSNQCDRIHAYLLWLAEQQYGTQFWPDFFTNVRAKAGQFGQAKQISDGDKNRNARYRLSLDCFAALGRIDFRKMLGEAGVSVTTDVKSLHPEDPHWNRKLQ